MTTKKCSYKGCNVFSSSTHHTSETLYSFPKQPDRLALWMKHGGSLNEKQIPYASRYFCSRHFDESKYVANNPRRKQLLGTAIPFPCEPDSNAQNNSNISDENDYQCVVSSVHIMENADDVDVDDEKLQDDEIPLEVSNEINCISESVEELENYEVFHNDNEITDPADIEILEAVRRPPKLRKIDYVPKQTKLVQDSLIVKPRRSVAALSNRPTSTINIHVAEGVLYDDLEENTTAMPIEPSNVTTFIFKGEEYIQMPKEQYNREKVVMLNRIRAYEEIFKNVKHLIDTVKI